MLLIQQQYSISNAKEPSHTLRKGNLFLSYLKGETKAVRNLIPLEHGRISSAVSTLVITCFLIHHFDIIFDIALVVSM